MNENGNKSNLTIIIWIMGVVFLGGLSMLTNAVVANDRIRASEDKIIDYRIDKVKDSFNEKVELILIKIARLESILTK